MPGSMPALFELLSARAGWLQVRHAVLAQNLANADTPGYRPSDLVEPDFARLVDAGRQRGPALVTATRTSPLHLAGSAPAGPAARQHRLDAFEIAPAGNAVLIEEQIRLMSQTERGYQLASSLYGKYASLVRTALGAGG